MKARKPHGLCRRRKSSNGPSRETYILHPWEKPGKEVLPYRRQYCDVVESLTGSGKKPGKGCGEGESHKKKEQRTIFIIWHDTFGWRVKHSGCKMFCLVCVTVVLCSSVEPKWLCSLKNGT